MKTISEGTKIALKRIKFAKNHQLVFLNLSYLNLREIPQEIVELPHLTHLFLNNNQIEEIEVIKTFHQLEVLSLNHNNIKELPLFLLSLNMPFLDTAANIFTFISIKISEFISQFIVRNRDSDRDRDKDLARILDLKRYIS